MWSMPTNAYANPYESQPLTSPGQPVTSHNTPFNDVNGEDPNSSGGIVDRLLPPVPSQFPDLATKSPKELESLVYNKAALTSYVTAHPYYSELNHQVSQLQREIELLRRANETSLSEESFTAVNERLQQGEDEEKKLRKLLEEKMMVKRQWMEKNSPAALANRLSEAVDEAESQSEKLHGDAMCATMDMAEFVNQFLEKRTLYHMRRSKLQHFQQMLANSNNPAVNVHAGSGLYTSQPQPR